MNLFINYLSSALSRCKSLGINFLNVFLHLVLRESYGSVQIFVLIVENNISSREGHNTL